MNGKSYKLRELHGVCTFCLENIAPITIALTVLLIGSARSVQTVYFTAGMYVCGFGAKALQRCLRQARPKASNKSSYGMPSAHSSTVCYLAVYTTLCAASGELAGGLAGWKLLSGNPEFELKSEARMTTSWFIAFVVSGVASSVCWSRYYFSHHTPVQIGAGLIYGFCFATIWFGLCHQSTISLLLQTLPANSIASFTKLFLITPSFQSSGFGIVSYH
ncbi:hypothetical protein CROQUDRAFT_665154 [Cronartium quercuum f. sp. fusiforme G11]|uniref:Phosphatidic acid phosphatase type 2/haloperoxidase domain-containing protein n=1 Tax=Cronartium quercuum f. sp. fusiforme G11 TaxID=708437 RepID=A0A9P6T6D5_9BASI|nr:hypothetical protein CROQUDRAFT_665154 [Cronartium quercuum f. sp. fusiforme G11]